MRPVPYDYRKIKYPDGWEIRAKNALEAVRNVPDEQKADEVNKHRDVWVELRQELSKVFYGKCWYTESLQVGTDTDIDHFRPKNSVNGIRNPLTNDKHPGYWWRAFDASNYRFSCIVANRRRRDLESGVIGGKADAFPIWEENDRAWCPDDSCDDELPLLIDPCKPDEVALITFGENGEATERYRKEQKQKQYEQAHNSIMLYHLNHSDFIRERIKIRDNIMELIEDAHRYYQKLGTANEDADDDHAYSRAIAQLRQACSIEAPFSSFAIAMLRPYRNDESLEGVFI